MRIYLLLIGLSFLLSANAIAQRSALVITGTVIEVKPTAERILKNGKYEKQETYFAVRLRLVYHNRGEVPLIVPKPGSFYYGKRRLLFLEIPSSESKVSATADEWMFPGSSDPIPYFLKELALVEPSRYHFAVIEPGGYYETGDTIRARSGYKLELRPNPEKYRPDLEFAIPEHSAFKVRYSSSLKDRPEGSDLLADAGRRWSRFGKLVLNSDGDFFFETEVIINKLPD